MKVQTVALTSDEQRKLAWFVAQRRENREGVLLNEAMEPQISAPLLYAYRVVHALIA